MTEGFAREFGRGADVGRMREVARDQAMTTLRQDGWHKVQAGVTTVEEVLRVTEG